MAKYNVGDKVVVRDDLENNTSYGLDSFVSVMESHKGKVVTIDEIVTSTELGSKYHIVEDRGSCNWTDQMFVGLADAERIEEMETVIAQFPKISVPERDDSNYIERCVKLAEELFNKYSCSSEDDVDYPYTEDNLRRLIISTNNNKKELNDLLSRNPYWDNDTHSIVFEMNLVRAIDRLTVNSFFNWIKAAIFDVIPEETINNFGHGDIRKSVDQMTRIVAAFECLRDIEREMSIICNYSYSDAIKERNRWLELKDKLRKKGELVVFGTTDKIISVEDANKVNEVIKLLDVFMEDKNFDQFVNENFANRCAEFEEATGIKINGVVGKKVSRVINALCKSIGLDKIKDIKTTVTGREYDDGYNRRYAEFADAINPVVFKQKTIITTDIIAFLTASFGNGWSSCFTLDKRDYRDGGENYSGCYQGGTTAYGNDKTSFVVYTIRNDFDGKDYVLEDKINRCFFSLGEGKLIQSRNYPDGRDGGDSSLAKQFREIVQKIITQCYDIPNLWVNRKGVDECGSVIRYEGGGYHDHVSYDDCNVSYWKGESEGTILNTNKITIGAVSICPNCGRETKEDETILCNNCYEEVKGGVVYCTCCGQELDPDGDYTHWINGDPYCDDCSFWCEYHEEWEAGDSYYIEGYGDVCDYAIDSGDFAQCEYCGNWFRIDDGDGVETIDEYFYCCDDHAERGGYVRCQDDIWRKKDDVYECEECGEYVTEDEYDFEHDMCKECAESLEKEEETVA